MKNISHHPESEPRPITQLDRSTSPFAGICFSLFLIGGIVTTGYALVSQNLNLISKEASWSTFLNGDVSSGIAKSLANAPFPDNAAKFERGLSWLITRDLGPRVREGKNDWLFLNDELVVHQGRVLNAESRVKEIIEVGHQLANQGIELLIVLVPDKSRIESEYLGSQHRATVFSTRVNDFEKQLTHNEIHVINLTGALNSAKQGGITPFLRTDTHWSEPGAEIAAKAVAKSIQSLKITPSPAQSTQIVAQVDKIQPGDLVKLAGIDWLPTRLQPAPESARYSSFKSVPIPSNEKSKSMDDLFGDANLPNIALIGTSFSRTSEFIPYLEMQLDAKIGNFALDGGDFSGSAKAYFTSPAFKDTPPKLIIWEIPERVLEMDRNHDEKILKGSF
jgi:alginate O-acetyltransferase complex protein AlgJ